MEIVVFYVPCPDREAADRLMKNLLEGQLIACGNILSSESRYIWNQEAVEEHEWIAIMKTLPELEQQTENQILMEHPYELPAIIRFHARVNHAYYTWIRSVVLGE